MYVKIVENVVDTFPYTINNLKEDNPKTSFPKVITEELLNSYGVYSVTELEEPTYDEKTQDVSINSEPTLVEGVWTLSWTTTSKTNDEVTEANSVKSNFNRAIRDNLLSETDWWAVSDRTMSSEETTYRQALRDLPTHSNWPWLEDADWPVKPS